MVINELMNMRGTLRTYSLSPGTPVPQVLKDGLVTELLRDLCKGAVFQ